MNLLLSSEILNSEILNSEILNSESLNCKILSFEIFQSSRGGDFSSQQRISSKTGLGFRFIICANYMRIIYAKNQY